MAPEKKGLANKKQCLAGLRKFFNLAVERHICLINPAAVAETERLSIVEGKTPTIDYEAAWLFYQSIDRSILVGTRDLAVLSTLNFSGARAGAVSLLDVDNYYQAGDQGLLHFDEKNNKSREIPVPHDQQEYLTDWLEASQIKGKRRRRDPATGQWIPHPLFRTFVRRTGKLAPYEHETRDQKTGDVIQTERGRMTGQDITRMMKRDWAHSYW